MELEMGGHGEVGVSRQVDEVQVERSIVHRRRRDILESHGRRCFHGHEDRGCVDGGVLSDVQMDVQCCADEGERVGHFAGDSLGLVRQSKGVRRL